MLNYKNKYKGKRVFILGNGPSLQKTNLNLIKDEYSIAMNRISKIYDKTNWRPSFFVCTTSNVEDEEWRKDILETVDMGVPTFIWDELSKHFDKYENIYNLKCTNGSEVSMDPPLEWWSYDIEQRVTKFGTSMIVALQIAVYMGFDEIYILGADLGFKTSLLQKIFYRLRMKKIGHMFDKNHFFGSYGTPGFNSDTLNKNMVGAHVLAKKACEEKDIKVYNASIGGALEVYPRVDYYSLLKDK